MRRNSMRSLSTSEQSHAPERTAGAAAAEEELIAGWCGVVLLAGGKKERGSKRKRGSGEMGARAMPLHSPLLIALEAEKPRGRAWD